MPSNCATTEQVVSTFRRHRYENDDKTFWSDAYTVKGWADVAFRVLGWQLVPDEDTEWTGIYERTGDVYAIMVGDDKVWCVDVDDLQPLDVEAFCHECGQIGCTHDGRSR
jgi:hypothetical protein